MLVLICQSAATKIVSRVVNVQIERIKMNINEKEELAAERVIHTAYGQAMKYSHGEDLKAATVALLWASFVKEAKDFGLDSWKGLKLE